MPIRIVARAAKGRIRNTSRIPQGLSARDVAAAFEAKPLDVSTGGDSSPMALLMLRDQIAQRLQSTGGRPSLAHADKKVKIPVTDADWKEVEFITEQVRIDRFKPSPTQVASVLLHMAVQQFSSDEIEASIEAMAERSTG